MALTPKQEKFAQLVADGKTQADAYRGAYNATTMADKTIIETASKLMSDSNVSTRVKELRQELSQKALWTREDSVRVLKEVIEDGRAGDKTAAVKELNMMHGFNAPTKIEHSGEHNFNIRVIWE